MLIDLVSTPLFFRISPWLTLRSLVRKQVLNKSTHCVFWRDVPHVIALNCKLMTNPPSPFAQQCAAALNEAAAALPPTVTERLAVSRQQALVRAACAPQRRGRVAAWTAWLSPQWVAVAGSVALGVVAAWLWLHDPLPADAAMDIALLTGDLPVEVYLTPHFSTKL